MSQVHDEMRNMTMANFYKADLVDGDMWNDDEDKDGDDNDEYDGDGDDDDDKHIHLNQLRFAFVNDGDDDEHLHLGQPPALVLQQCKDLAPESESAWFFLFSTNTVIQWSFQLKSFLMMLV